MTEPLAGLRFLAGLMLMICGLLWTSTAQAQNCAQATSQGRAPANWQTYCWLNLTNYNDALARGTTGQDLSFNLPDGSVLAFNARVTGTTAAYEAVDDPSWTGSAVGNSAFIGIPGNPVLYTAGAGTRSITLSNITVRPPAGGGATVYSFVVADGESSNDNEALRIRTNGGAWQLLDSVPPISGSAMPTISGVGTGNVTIGGVSGTVGAYIVGSNSPTSITVETQAGGLQGVMFAIRFASIRLQTQILGSRVASGDQFAYQIASSATSLTLAGGSTSGTTSGPFTMVPLAMSAGVPVTLRLAMLPGSTSTLAAYAANLTCTNIAGATRTGLPNNVSATSLDIGQLQFGEFLVCTFQVGAQPRLALRKQLGGGGRRFAGDQFIMRISDGSTIIASTTTTGTSGTINNGTTGLVQVISQRAYTLDEAAAGTTNLGNYAATMSCNNATSGSTTVLPSTVGGTIIPRPGDAITCTITNTRRTVAVLEIEKTSRVISDPLNGSTNPKAIPGALVEYSITVLNVGSGRPDTGSIAIIDRMPPETAFVNAIPVRFIDGTPTSALAPFDPVTMVSFSQTEASAETFNYRPNGSVDPNVRAIRIIPTGQMSAATSGTNQPSFTIRFTAEIR